MARSLAFAVVFVAVIATAAPVRADGFYYSESVGNAWVRDELRAFLPHDAARIRVAIGARHGLWAVDAWLSALIDNGDVGTYRFGTTARPDAVDPNLWGVDLKRFVPLSRHLELYVRGTVSAARVPSEPTGGRTPSPLAGFAGRGLGYGAGVVVKGRVPALGFLFFPAFFTNVGPKVLAALYVDTGYERYRLHGPGRSVDAQLTHAMLGFAVGTDF